MPILTTRPSSAPSLWAQHPGSLDRCRVADTGFVEAVGTLSPRQVDRLTASLERHPADPRSMPPQALLSQLHQAISEAYQLPLHAPPPGPGLQRGLQRLPPPTAQRRLQQVQVRLKVPSQP